jgi:branched-chain amino acid transport system substrate-binding protein
MARPTLGPARVRVRFAFWLTALCASAACGPQGTSKTEVPIGLLLSLTGDLSWTGVPMSETVALAVSDINEAGGVLGHTLVVATGGDGSTEEKAAVAAQALIARKVSVVIGSDWSTLTLAAAETLSKSGVVLISPSATSPALTTFADDGFLFRTCPSDAFQGKLLAQRAKAKGYRRAALLSVPGPYGDGMAAAFAETFEAGGGTVTYRSSYVELEDSYGQLLEQVFATNPEVVVLPGYPVDSAKIVKAYALNYVPSRSAWMFGDALATSDFVTAVGPAAFAFRHEGTAFSSPTGAKWAAFAQAYKIRTGQDAVASDGVAQAYDAVMVAALAMAKAGSFEGAPVRDALLALKGGTAYGPGEFKEAVAALANGLPIHYAGVSGPIDFDDHGDITAAVYDIWQVRDGAFTMVETGVSPQ